jgi:hypothetical protein
MNLTKQQRKVANYIWAHRGCTTKDIMLGTGIQCPSGRITELRQAGVNIISIGQKRYAGARAFECYAIEKPKPLPPCCENCVVDSKCFHGDRTQTNPCRCVCHSCRDIGGGEGGGG